MARLSQRQPGLPAEVSSLVGRGSQIAAVLEGLRASRVVTLTGPGGCGKTRLALRTATLAASSFQDGARLVELAALTDPALVPATIAETLEVSEREATDPMAGIVRALADRELLIVLDNCEHVLESAARAVACWPGSAARSASWPPAGNAWTCRASWFSRCRRWNCRKTVRPVRSPRPRPAGCSSSGPARRARRSS